MNCSKKGCYFILRGWSTQGVKPEISHFQIDLMGRIDVHLGYKPTISIYLSFDLSDFISLIFAAIFSQSRKHFRKFHDFPQIWISFIYKMPCFFSIGATDSKFAGKI
jgi:hypothetical protein